MVPGQESTVEKQSLRSRIFATLTGSGLAFNVSNCLAFAGHPATLAVSAVASCASLAVQTIRPEAQRLSMGIACASTAVLAGLSVALHDTAHAAVAGLFAAGNFMVASKFVQGMRGNKQDLQDFAMQAKNPSSQPLRRRLAQFVMDHQNRPDAAKRGIMAATTSALYWNPAYCTLAVLGGGADVLSHPMPATMLGLGVTTTLVSAVGVATGKLKNPASPFVLTSGGSVANAACAALAKNWMPALNLACAAVGEGRLGYTFWQPSAPAASNLVQRAAGVAAPLANMANRKLASVPSPSNSPVHKLLGRLDVFPALDRLGNAPIEAGIRHGILPIPRGARPAMAKVGME